MWLVFYVNIGWIHRKRPVTARKTGLFVECGVILAKFLFLPSEQFYCSEAISIIPRKNANVNTFYEQFFYFF